MEEPKKTAAQTPLTHISWYDLSKGDELASGSFGCVYKGTWGWWDKVDVAIKQKPEYTIRR